MSAATGAQIRRLDGTVAGFKSEPWEMTGTQAVLYIEITPEGGAYLFFRPVGEKNGKEVWVGELVKEWAKEPDQRTEGSYDEVLHWLHNRRKELAAKFKAIFDMRNFTDMRKGWKFYDGPDYSKVYSGRVFDYGRDQVLLAVQPEESRLVPLLATVSLKLSAGPEASSSGKANEISEWVDDWDKCLALPLRLKECKSDEAAREIVASAPAAHIGRLAYLLEHEGTMAEARRWLLDMFVPKLTRSRG